MRCDMNEKKTLVRHIVTLVLSVAFLITSVTVTLAWMENGESKRASRIELAYKDGSTPQIGIQANELYVEMYKKIDGEYIEVDSSSNEPIFTNDNMAPSDSIEFRFDIYNLTNTDVSVDIIFSGITGTTPEGSRAPKLADALYLSLTSTDGYDDASAKRPDGTFERMCDILTYIPVKQDSATEGASSADEATDGEEKEYVITVSFSENLIIPPTGAKAEDGSNKPITVYGYLLFDRNAGSEYEACTFKVDKILILA